MAEGFITRRGVKAEELPTYIVATGGTETTYQDESTIYKVHTFTSSGTFTVNLLGNELGGDDKIEYLIVAGGGGGGGSSADGWNAGGGGAGGLITNIGDPNFSVTKQNYSIVVGAGGVRGNASNTNNGSVTTQGSNGGNSSAFGLTAVGGGGGGASSGFTGGQGSKTFGRSGGSGGGAGSNYNSSTPVGGSGTSGQGNSGGTGSTTGSGYGGTGGSWSSNGTSTVTGNSGPAGRTLNFDGTSKEFARAGGTGVNNPVAWGPNLGHGGHAAYMPPNTIVNSIAGSSGIVIIRYQIGG
jgi:hypothetical protein